MTRKEAAGVIKFEKACVLRQDTPRCNRDWNKVPIDTPILVKKGINSEWIKRYFAGYMWGKVCAFDNGNTSEDFNGITPWKYAKLAEQEIET